MVKKLIGDLYPNVSLDSVILQLISREERLHYSKLLGAPESIKLGDRKLIEQSNNLLKYLKNDFRLLIINKYLSEEESEKVKKYFAEKKEKILLEQEKLENALINHKSYNPHNGLFIEGE